MFSEVWSVLVVCWAGLWVIVKVKLLLVWVHWCYMSNIIWWFRVKQDYSPEFCCFTGG